jgi:hypothetical protein
MNNKRKPTQENDDKEQELGCPKACSHGAGGDEKHVEDDYEFWHSCFNLHIRICKGKQDCKGEQGEQHSDALKTKGKK